MPTTHGRKDIQRLTEALRYGHLKPQEQIRIQAVLLKKKGYTHKQIEDMTLKSKDAIQDWVTLFNKKGIESLKNQPITKPRHYTLTPRQKNQIKQMLTRHTPEFYGLDGEFWTTASLQHLVKKKFHTNYKSHKSYVQLFRDCGFSYQKVEFKDSRADEVYKSQMKLRLKKKLKKGVLKMYW